MAKCKEGRGGGGGWLLAGGGFGTRHDDSFVNRIVRSPSSVLTTRLLKKLGCSDDILALGRQIAKTQSRLFDYDCARQVLTVAFIEKCLPDMGKDNAGMPKVVAVIGDGYGYLGALLKKRFPSVGVIEINLGRTLFFDAYYLQQTFPEERHRLVEQTADLCEGGIFYLPAEDVGQFSNLGVSLYINIASMQEMDAQVIGGYFRLMRSEETQPVFFYCCNREEKQLPDGTWSRFSDYGWLPSDNLLADDLCPWHQAYPSVFPPRWKLFDGPTRHRVICLGKK